MRRETKQVASVDPSAPQEGPPDMSTDRARRAYRAELRAVANGWRWSGAALIFVALMGVIYNLQTYQRHGTPLEIASLALMAVGWVLFGVAFIKTNAYHRRRISGGG
jgi:anti-sigma-K factor RskA